MKLSVIVATYNRSAQLRQTLHQLTRQSLQASDFEVVVSDDGSADDTAEVVRSFANRLRIRYHFQQDLGFRAAAARNAGARMARGPILVFLDAGALAGPDFLRGHLAEHAGGGRRRAVVGYAYGHNPGNPPDGLGELIGRYQPEQIRQHFIADPAFADVRQPYFERCGFDLDRRATPWNLLFAVNCSFQAADFWAVGGFDETFQGWGGEDLELGFRLFEHGLSFRISRDAWVIESPHERQLDDWLREFMVNMRRYLAKHPEPVMEIGRALIGLDLPAFDWNEEYHRLLVLTGQLSERMVDAELADAVEQLPAGDRIAVVGCGGVLPESLPPA
ncbi:MAG TPA: glycosyltransferase, partial [Jatrophihabitans sp.]|nr:glycosyltransferase [Jatrophihabitans sp.]